jgi:hypothetical protein
MKKGKTGKRFAVAAGDFSGAIRIDPSFKVTGGR